MLAAIASSSVGYVALALLVGGESAGVPLPGETALITAGILASRGHLSLPLVIAVAAAAAIVGDNVGYVIGRRGGRWLLTRPGRWHDERLALVERGERFFARHGGKTVFFGRWLPVLRITAAWLAGGGEEGGSDVAKIALRPRPRLDAVADGDVHALVRMVGVVGPRVVLEDV